MEGNLESRRNNISFLGKKTRKSNKDDQYKSYEADNSSQILDISAESSSDNTISLENNREFKKKIPGFDDIKIPSFLNDFTDNVNINNAFKRYSKMKEEFGELAKLYLIDINKIYKQKRK